MKPALGILVSPPIGVFLVTLLMGVFATDLRETQFIEMVILYSVVGSILGWLSALVFGAPLYWVYLKLKAKHVLAFTAGGAMCALPFWLIWFYPSSTEHFEQYVYVSSVYFFSIGAMSGAIFWYLVVRPKAL